MTGPAAHIERDDPRYRKLARDFRAECETSGTPCWLCGQPIDYRLRHKPGKPIPDGAFEADHAKTWADYPALRLDRSNLRAAHKGCNRRRGKRDASDLQRELALGEPSRTW